MKLYIIPVIVFLAISICVSIYTYDEKKPKINVQGVLFAIVLSILVFLCMKYQDISHEPMMHGNYFDTI
jgi:membrane protein YdbS with pleckstrin-like domain